MASMNMASMHISGSLQGKGGSRSAWHEKAPEQPSAAGALPSINFVGLRFVLMLVKGLP
jgi:hypothetical protein